VATGIRQNDEKINLPTWSTNLTPPAKNQKKPATFPQIPWWIRIYWYCRIL